MKIGIIGAGHIGATAARLFIKAGHEVALSNSRGPESLQILAQELGPSAHVLTVDEAARYGDIVLLAVPWARPEALPTPDAVAGKVVIDAMNPYNADGSIQNLSPSTSSGETAKRLPRARLVKAFNTIWFEHLAENGNNSQPVEQRHAIFVAGDDDEAKNVVTRLIEQIGFAPVDTGSLHDGGKSQEPNTSLYNRTLTGAEAQREVAQLRAVR